MSAHETSADTVEAGLVTAAMVDAGQRAIADTERELGDRPIRQYPESWRRTLALAVLERAVPLAAAKSVSGVQVQRPDGAWVPAIPLPLFGVRKRCQCKRSFWTMGGYRGHYALAHILETP